jgi:galactokinase
MKEIVETKFKEIFGTEGRFKTYFAPGRVNLIGEHTDYNGGHVFPCALTMGTYATVREREDKILNFYSMNFDDLGILTSSIDNLVYNENENWINYPKGVIWALKNEGYNIDHGFDIVYYGTIPNGAGLSSSASLEVLTGFILKDMFKLDMDNTKIALIGQMAENKYVGVNCGIMDQFVIANGKKDNAVFLDTATLEYKYAPINLENEKIVIINTNKKRGLGDSKYNVRRAECEKALEELQESGLQIKSLGDLTEEEFEEHKSAIKDEIRQKRAKHAVYENQRTLKAVQALENNDLELFGKLMVESHNSLRDDYEVTGIELDTAVEEALKQEGVIGARMTGAGFGGCAVSIVKTDKVENFIKNVEKGYREKIGYNPEFYVVEIGNGVRAI